MFFKREVFLFISMHVDECELGTLVCVGRVGDPQKFFNPPPQFLRLGIQVSLAILCLFVWAMVGWVTLPFFSFFSLTLLHKVTQYTNQPSSYKHL